jgi:hypothetical protein
VPARQGVEELDGLRRRIDRRGDDGAGHGATSNEEPATMVAGDEKRFRNRTGT